MSLLRFCLFLTLLVAVAYGATFQNEKRDASQPPLSALQSSPAMRVRMQVSPASSDLPSNYQCNNSACNSLCQALGWCVGACLDADWCLCWC